MSGGILYCEIQKINLEFLNIGGEDEKMINIFDGKKYKLFERGTKHTIDIESKILKEAGYSIRRRKGKNGWELWVRKK